MNKYIVDFRKAKTYEDLHEILKKSLGFPDYYGKNLDALWDCLMDYCYDWYIEIIGTDSIEKSLDNDMKKIIEVFTDLIRRYKSSQVAIVEASGIKEKLIWNSN